MEILRPANLCLVALVFFFSLNLAPMMFESFTSDRIWASNPPESFYSSVGVLGGDVLRSRASRWIFLNYFRITAGVLAYVLLMCAVLAPGMESRTSVNS